VPEAAQGTELPQLPPQPASHGPLDSLRYAVTVLRGIYLRRTRIARLRRTNVEAQTRLDDVLRELGRAARTEKLQLAGLAEEMQATDAAQERKARAEAERAEYQRVRDAEQQKLEQFASEKLREIADCKAELTAREAERKGKLSERRALTDQLARFDAQLKSIGRQVQSKQAELIKKVTTVDAPTEPTGDEAASGAVVSAAIGDSARLRLETEIETLQQSATALDEPREAAQDKLRQLEAPIAELLLSIDTLRERGETLRRELETAQRESAAEQRTLEAEADKRANEIHSASREISQRLSTLGTLVNLKRVDSPLFAPLYQQVDGLKLEMAQRDTQIQGLSAEAEAYDRSALHKGLVAAALLAAGLVALLVVLAVAL
jgi:chromosome segregation ATPase